jgi:3-oxoacyl-[acyl-carrier-protein] synthase-1
MLEIAARANVAELRLRAVGISILRERIDNAKLGAVLSNRLGYNGVSATLIYGNSPAKTLRKPT